MRGPPTIAITAGGPLFSDGAVKVAGLAARYGRVTPRILNTPAQNSTPSVTPT